jgi:hypothetical protein
MLPGPTKIIACPFCGQFAKKETIISANTFRAQLWSDCKSIAPMMPDFPKLTVCKKCDQFFWVKDAKEVETVTDHKELNEKWHDLYYIEFPTFHQYFKALELIPDELFIRAKIWRSFNDFFRDKKEDQITSEMKQMNTENLTSLLIMLDDTDNNELLMKVEVFRNLGEFEASKELLNRMKDPNLDWVKNRLMAEIHRKNRNVIKLD